ncbi:MAG: hypothetical protein OHK0045_24630 [Raineya sp.]
MYQVTNILFMFLLISTLYSCGKKVEMSEKKYGLKAIKSLTISIDSLTQKPIFAKEVSIWKNCIVILNEKQQKLQFYNLQNGIFIKSINLAKEGDNGVGKIKDFLVLSEDSIFVLSPTHYKVYLINQNGKVLDKYNLINSSKFNENSAMPDPMFFYHPLIILGGKLHISSVPDDNPYFESFYKRKNLATVVDLQNRFVSYDYSFPENYRKYIYPSNMNFYSRVYIPHLNKFAYSFLQDSYIRIVSVDYKEEIRHLAVPDGFIPYQGLKKRVTDAIEDSKIGNTLPSFIFLTHDPFRKKTYRLLYLPEEKNNKSKMLLMEFDEKFSKNKVLTFSEKKKTKYNPLNIFFTSEGMWIQRFTDNEDELVYDLVEFVAE